VHKSTSGAGEREGHSSGKSRRKPPWLVLSLGFGGLLVFILAAATGTFLVLKGVRQEETTTRHAFLGRLSTLDQIRAGIYLSGTYVRDLLDCWSSAAPAVAVYVASGISVTPGRSCFPFRAVR
jgi:hypothetical protein